MEHKIEKKIQEHKRYVQQSTEDAATEEERQEIFAEMLANLSNKKRVNK